MKRHLWENKNLDSNYECPHCNKGILEYSQEGSLTKQTVSSRLEDEFLQKEHQEPCARFQSYYSWTNLRCNKCFESVFCSGEFWDSMDLEGHENEPNFGERFSPKAFFPILPIIDIPEGVSQIIKDELNVSFELYWVNESACANSLRKVLELIMDEKGVQKMKNLHQRIQKFKNTENEILIAIKEIGNTGSHDTVEREYVLDGYLFLQHTLNEEYGEKLGLISNAKKVTDQLKN